MGGGGRDMMTGNTGKELMVLHHFTRQTAQAILAGFLCMIVPGRGTSAAESPFDLVDPFVGSAPLTDPDIIGYTPPHGWRVWAGLTFPGAALPHGMVQLSPVTTWVSGSGYWYEDDVINGFTHTNKGHWNLCNISVMPVVTTLYIQGPGDRLGPYSQKGYGSRFSHDREDAEPGYYTVFLDDYRTKVELTVTPRTGFHRYTFPESDVSHILIDLGKANQTIEDAHVEIPDTRTIRGWQRFGRTTVCFHAEFDKPFGFSGTWRGWRTQVYDGKPLEESGADCGAFVKYSTEEGQVVQVRIGLSFVSMENAKKNLDHENPGWDFDAVRRAAKTRWETFLNAVEVEGGKRKERVMFYSSLYRAAMWPTLRSDADGSFVGADGEVDTTGTAYYTLPSLWDTFRNKVTLVNMLEPEIMRDIIRSTIDMGTKRGWMPTFFFGDHAVSMITGSYLRGLTDFDVEEAYRLMRKNATESGGTRGDIAEYAEKGYFSTVPVEKADEPPAPGRAGVMKTIEYAYDDYCLALLAKELGKDDDCRLFMERSRNYRNVFDAGTNFMRGKTADGRWVEPFNPEFPYYGYMYREANAWQSTFFVPHDVPGLIGLMGGAVPFVAKLDSLFTLPWNPSYIARNCCCFMGQYCQGNQPDHHAPYLYVWAGRPWKTQERVRAIMDRFFGIGEKGRALPGMDDAGEMSSWYVYNAMGFYPVAPSTPQYVVGSPVFDRVTIHLPDYLYGGADFILEAKNNSYENKYIQSIAVDGEPVENLWFTEELLKRGATVTVTMGPRPNTSLGAKPGNAPPVIR